MLGLHTIWRVPVVLTLAGFVLSAAKATAHTIYPFSANYDVSATSRAITSDLAQTTISGLSTDAPYDLTTLEGQIYSQVDFATGFYRFNTDPATFGLQDVPSGFIVFGSGPNKLFGTDNATGLIDFTTLTAKASGTFTITSGEGIFTGATGTIAFSEVDTLSLDPNVPTRAKSSVNGSIVVSSIKTVPEPRTVTTLVGIGAIGFGLLLGRRSRSYLSS